MLALVPDTSSAISAVSKLAAAQYVTSHSRAQDKIVTAFAAALVAHSQRSNTANSNGLSRCPGLAPQTLQESSSMGSKKKSSGAATAPTAADSSDAAALAAKRAAKFAKGASVHVTKALLAMDKIATLGNKRRYFYTTDQGQKILDALDAKVQAIEAAFAAPVGAKVSGLKFEV